MCESRDGVSEEDLESSSQTDVVNQTLFFFLVVALGAYLTTAIYSSGVFWHITLGRWIIANGALPHENIWTYAAQGHVWTTKTWLFDVLLAGVHQFAGDRGLAILKVSLNCLFALTLCFVLSRRAGNRFLGTCLGCLVACGTLLVVPLEPAIIGWIFFLLLLEITFSYLEHAVNRGLLFGAFALMVLYVNFHPSALFAVVCALVVYCSSPERKLRQGLIYFGLLIVAGFLTPSFGANIIGALSEFASTAQTALGLRESPATVYDYSLCFLLVLWFFLVWFWKEHPRSFSMGEVLVVSFATLAGLATKTYISFSLILVALFAAALWGRAEEKSFGRIGEGIERLRVHAGKYPFVGVSWIALVVVIINVAPLLKTPVLTSAFPVREMDYVLKEKLEFPLLHDSSIGGYVIYRLSDSEGKPENLAAVDRRIEGLSPYISLISSGLSKLGLGWKQFFEQIAPKTVLCRVDTPLYEILVRDTQWRLVFEAGQPITHNRNRAYVGAWAVFCLESLVDSLAQSEWPVETEKTSIQ